MTTRTPAEQQIRKEASEALTAVQSFDVAYHRFDGFGIRLLTGGGSYDA